MNLKKIGKAGLLITKIHRIARRIFSKKLRDKDINDLTPSQFRIIFSLMENDMIPISKLGTQLSLTKSTLTSLLDNLEEQGYIQRIHSNKDRRIILIKLKHIASKRMKRYQDIIIEMNELFYHQFSDQEISAFEESLQKILSNLINFERENS
jgi:DNA-binding MarR family transcriptional regulator